jgi:integrating conjugative element relaxase (TIGR03760 family)
MSLGVYQWSALAVGTAALGAGSWILIWQWKNHREAQKLGSLGQRLYPSAATKAARFAQSGSDPGDGSTLIPAGASEIPVYTAPELIHRLGLESLINSIRSKSGLTQTNFDADCLPVIHSVMELVQLFPASESHHHANPGGLLVHGLETLSHALSIRQGVLLPQGAQPEDIQKHQHRWTYAIFLGALLHDIGKPLSDLTVKAFAGAKSFEWNPVSGNLLQCGATGYRLQFRDTREYGDHQRLAVVVMQRLVPQQAMQWLSVEPSVLKSLMTYLAGDAGGEVPKALQSVKVGAQNLGSSNPIAQLVSRADQESVRHNLATGSRQRFATARSLPLIERLMGALREMLQEGGILPLNRKGAVGWVFEGEAWFVSKRLVDEIRGFLVASNRAVGFPGVDRNDRIFDTLQEFGAVISNPMTHRAIWSVRIEQNDGWSESFTVLRFPLAKLFESESLFPSPMQGVIRIQMKDESGAVNVSTSNPSAQPKPSLVVPTVMPLVALSAASTPAVPSLEPSVFSNTMASQKPAIFESNDSNEPIKLEVVASTPWSPLEPALSAEALDPNDLSLYDPEAVAVPDEVVSINPDPSFEPSLEPSLQTGFQEPSNSLDAQPFEAERFTDEGAFQNALQAGESRPETVQRLAPVLYLRSQDMAPSAGQAPPTTVGKSVPVSVTPPVLATLLAPVTPALPSLPKLMIRQGKSKAAKAAAEPPPLATQFMRWLQEGIASGEISINNSKAQVHFAHVEHSTLGNEGQSEKFMLLVSPAIFRNFAGTFEGTEQSIDAIAIQKEFLKAAWHVSIWPGNVNILRFLTNATSTSTGRAGQKSLLSCIAVRNPERFVNPLPPINDILTYSHELTAKPQKEKMGA